MMNFDQTSDLTAVQSILKTHGIYRLVVMLAEHNVTLVAYVLRGPLSPVQVNGADLDKAFASLTKKLEGSDEAKR